MMILISEFDELATLLYSSLLVVVISKLTSPAIRRVNMIKRRGLSLVHLLIFFCSMASTSSLNGKTGDHQDSKILCPTGLFRRCKEGNCSCTCGRHYPAHIITCKGTRSFMLKYNCATYNSTKNVLSVGSCLRMPNITGNDTDYELLPEDINRLNTYMCGPSNRDGTMCGRCLPDHYPLAYSINNTCVRCPNVRWNWVKYMTASYLPLTVFYIVILVFNINTTSGYAFMVIFYCQTLAVPFRLRVLFYHLENIASPQLIVAAKLLWNMELGFLQAFLLRVLSWNRHPPYPGFGLCHSCVPSPPHDNHLPTYCPV